jgi:hypothetical protein
MNPTRLLIQCLALLSLGACGDGSELPSGLTCGEGTYPLDGECVPDTGLAECDCEDDSGGGGCEDMDGDGWPREDGDCDDADPEVNPGETEICDGKDNDCDGFVDNDAADGSDWYPDIDGDGYGDPEGEPIDSCSALNGYAADATDCDDGDASAYPGAEDVWYDGVDSDCEGDDDYDQDLDGYRSSDHGGEDCDDTSEQVGPHMEEICDDGLDND